jgi:hypothetical protein
VEMIELEKEEEENQEKQGAKGRKRGKFENGLEEGLMEIWGWEELTFGMVWRKILGWTKGELLGWV